MVLIFAKVVPKTWGVRLFTTAVTATGEEVAEQVLSLTVTEYAPVADATMDCVVAPVLQAYENPAGAIRPTEPPSQKVSEPEAVTVAGGTGSTLTCWLADVVLQPFAVTTTEYTPADVTEMLWVTAPLLHK